MNIIDPSTVATTGVTIAADATQDQWADIHRTILLCRSTSRLWLKQSRERVLTTSSRKRQSPTATPQLMSPFLA